MFNVSVDRLYKYGGALNFSASLMCPTTGLEPPTCNRIYSYSLTIRRQATQTFFWFTWYLQRMPALSYGLVRRLGLEVPTLRPRAAPLC